GAMQGSVSTWPRRVAWRCDLGGSPPAWQPDFALENSTMSALGTWSAPVTPMLGLKSIFPVTDGLISIRPRRDRLLHRLVGIAPCCTWMPWHRSGGSGS